MDDEGYLDRDPCKEMGGGGGWWEREGVSSDGSKPAVSGSVNVNHRSRIITAERLRTDRHESLRTR